MCVSQQSSSKQKRVRERKDLQKITSDTKREMMICFVIIVNVDVTMLVNSSFSQGRSRSDE
jgi:hypothetical protein